MCAHLLYRNSPLCELRMCAHKRMHAHMLSLGVFLYVQYSKARSDVRKICTYFGVKKS